MKKLAIQAVVVMALFFGSYGYVSSNTPHVETRAAATYAENLFNTGDCWINGEGHPMPTEVIVLDRDWNATLLTDRISVDNALNQVLGIGPEKFAHVMAFCA